jgi:SAM-dependent methyltransferase
MTADLHSRPPFFADPPAAGRRTAAQAVLPAGHDWVGCLGLRRLIQDEIARVAATGAVPLLLNMGPGDLVWVETDLDRYGDDDLVVDRIDVEPMTATAPHVGTVMTGSIESMPQVADGAYHVVFANYVVEHVGDVGAALREMRRVLRDGGLAVLTVPNPRAPEFRLAAHTPMAVHRIFQTNSHETTYAYRSIGRLLAAMDGAGLAPCGVVYQPVVGTYFGINPPPESRVRRLAPLGRLYDTLVAASRLRGLCGDVLIAARKVPT